MTDTPPPALTERQQFWLEHLRACDAEDKPAIEYAREHDLNPSGMYSARRDLVLNFTSAAILPQIMKFRSGPVSTNEIDQRIWQVVTLTPGGPGRDLLRCGCPGRHARRVGAALRKLPAGTPNADDRAYSSVPGRD